MHEESFELVLLDMDLNSALPSPRVENAEFLFKKITNEKQSELESKKMKKSTNNKVCDQVLKNLYSKLEPGPKKEKLQFREEKRVKDLISRCQEQRHIRSSEPFASSKGRALSAKTQRRPKSGNKSYRTYSAIQRPETNALRTKSSRPSHPQKSYLQRSETAPSQVKYVPSGRLLRRRKQKIFTSPKVYFSEANTKSSTASPFLQKQFIHLKPTLKKAKKSGAKLRLHFQNGINQIIEDCHDSKSQLEKLNEKINLFDNFCQKAILYQSSKPQRFKNQSKGWNKPKMVANFL